MSYKKRIENIMLNSTKQANQDGLIWYTRLNRFCRDLGEKYNTPTWKVAAIMSALSPRTSFENNVHDTEQLLKNGTNAKLKSPLFKKKALKIYNASCYNEVRKMFKEKTGRKTLSFWDNMANLESNRVTIDVHMIRHLGIEGSLTNKKYRDAENAVIEYAETVGVKPYQLQAMIWCNVRGKSW
jgi:hypothetical protein